MRTQEVWEDRKTKDLIVIKELYRDYVYFLRVDECIIDDNGYIMDEFGTTYSNSREMFFKSYQKVYK